MNQILEDKNIKIKYQNFKEYMNLWYILIKYKNAKNSFFFFFEKLCLYKKSYIFKTISKNHIEMGWDLKFGSQKTNHFLFIKNYVFLIKKMDVRLSVTVD